MIIHSIAKAIQEQWPDLRVTLSSEPHTDPHVTQYNADTGYNTQPKSTATNHPVSRRSIRRINLYYPIRHTGVSRDMPDSFREETRLWIATVLIYGEMIKLSVIRGEYCYKNVLSDPSSLDRLYTILATHIRDIRPLMPRKRRVLQSPNEPSELELEARVLSVAARLPTNLPLRQWGR
jgi:hypothetical protein